MTTPQPRRGGTTTLARWRTGLVLILAALFCGRLLGPRVGAWAWVLCVAAALTAVMLAALGRHRARVHRAGAAGSDGHDLLVWSLALLVLAVGSGVAGAVGQLT